MKKLYQAVLFVLLCGLAPLVANAQSFRVQCPTSTVTHPSSLHDNNSEPAYNGPTNLAVPATPPAGTNGGFLMPTATTALTTGNVNGAIKCQQIGGGDGLSTMGDGAQIYMFSFGPLSGLADIANGLPGTQFPNVFNTVYPGAFLPGDPATTLSAGPGGVGTAQNTVPIGFAYNGAVGLVTTRLPRPITQAPVSQALSPSATQGMWILARLST